MTTEKSKALFEACKHLIPGGVNSPVRAFRAVGGNPLFIENAKGPYMYDVDGNKYLDLINSWGPMILGHAFEPVQQAVIEAAKGSLSFGAPGRREYEMAQLITEMVPSVEMVRMVNSGTEACMSAIRVARGYTGRSKIIKFEGCYHGHADSFLIAAGSGAMTMGNPDSAGVTQGVANDTLTAPYNDLQCVRDLIDANKNQIAAIIVEPVVGNMGCVLPEKGFLQGLRDLCTKEGIVYIFDEVMTGFRLSPSGAQGLFDIQPDLSTFGKIIGGGLPVGAYGGKSELMQCVSPVGKVYQAGTLSGNPIAMASGLAMLKYLNDHPHIYDKVEKTTQSICNGMRMVLEKQGLDYHINQIGSMFSLFFTNEKVVNFASASTSNTQMFSKYFVLMLQNGIYLAPSQYESLFVSSSLNETHVAHYIEKFEYVIQKIHA